MEVDERPTEQYSDIGGLDQQIQEVNMFHNDKNDRYLQYVSKIQTTKCKTIAVNLY